jgi:hypothetical protein
VLGKREDQRRDYMDDSAYFVYTDFVECVGGRVMIIKVIACILQWKLRALQVCDHIVTLLRKEVAWREHEVNLDRTLFREIGYQLSIFSWDGSSRDLRRPELTVPRRQIRSAGQPSPAVSAAQMPVITNDCRLDARKVFCSGLALCRSYGGDMRRMAHLHIHCLQEN